jgi:predicted metal-dependent phosphoesterase TrpH
MKYIMSNMIDLHVHSTASDGSFTPERLVELASSMGMKAVALTDHDTLSGLEAAERRARELEILFIPGVEIEIDNQHGEFHMLGLRLGEDRSTLAKALAEVRRRRHDRNLRMIDKMRAAGFEVSMEELRKIAHGDIVSRAHFARLLMAKGLVSSVGQAFTRYLGKGKPFYEPRQSLGLTEAVSLIKGAGGKAVIAHPISLELRGPALRQFLHACRDVGVEGIEAYHPNHTPKEARAFARLAARVGFFATGGSDFHGESIPQRVLGRSSGGQEIPDKLLDALLDGSRT